MNRYIRWPHIATARIHAVRAREDPRDIQYLRAMRGLCQRIYPGCSFAKYCNRRQAVYSLLFGCKLPILFTTYKYTVFYIDYTKFIHTCFGFEGYEKYIPVFESYHTYIEFKYRNEKYPSICDIRCDKYGYIMRGILCYIGLYKDIISNISQGLRIEIPELCRGIKRINRYNAGSDAKDRPKNSILHELRVSARSNIREVAARNTYGSGMISLCNVKKYDYHYVGKKWQAFSEDEIFEIQEKHRFYITYKECPETSVSARDYAMISEVLGMKYPFMQINRYIRGRSDITYVTIC